jgi:starch synthase
MATMLDDYSRVRQTFNLVPSLLAQIEDYGGAHYDDLFLGLSRRPAGDLTPEERRFVLRWMRESPAFLRVQASPRYAELASRREDDPFSDGDMRDLQVWFNLAWCDPAVVDQDPGLSELKARDRSFSEADKETVISAHLDMLGRLIPSYAALAARGQAELTFSPYYHPILPLLADAAIAREALPDLPLPSRSFAHPADAERQIELGLGSFERLFGKRPLGMWPPELAVSQSTADLASAFGLEWLISDEEVLARSLGTWFERDHEGRPSQAELLYTPARVEGPRGEIAAVFRDSVLSNLIGFEYHRLPALEATGDFLRRLRRIAEGGGDREQLVVVALDGENAWDFYSREGRDFLEALYGELERAEDIVCTTVSDFLHEHPERHTLPRLHAGSWIGASLDTWIGDPEHNAAWDLLAETRDFVADYAEHHPGEGEAVAAAWREVMITEGSDWFWWFSRRHDSGMDAIWDNQFRLHLRNVYRLLGVRQPSRLFHPIIDRATAEERRQPAGLFTPEGRDDPAWAKAGRYETGSGFGALHKPAELVERVLFGSDKESLHIRVDATLGPEEMAAQGIQLWLYTQGSSTDPPVADAFAVPLGDKELGELDFEAGLVVRVEPRPRGARLYRASLSPDRREGLPTAIESASDPLCFSIPFRLLDKEGGEPMHFVLVASRGDAVIEQVPPSGSLGLRVPRRQGPELGSGRPLRILIAASESAPYARSGGLTEVSAALAKELHRQGHDVRVVIPRYRQVSIEQHGLTTVVPDLQVPLGGRSLGCSILEGRSDDVVYYFVDCPQLFDRDGMYGFGDDDARFIYFSRALLEMLQPLDFVPDVIHLHDWQTAIVPNLLDRIYAADPDLSGIATVLTVHNLAFQGEFGYGTLHLADLEPWGLMKVGIPRLNDIVNLLGRGIYFADVVNTVSERYALEIQTPEYGEGMDELLRDHAQKLYGVVNGIDVDLLDPARDPALLRHYSASDPAGKAGCKESLQTELKLEVGAAPLIAFISRFYEPKGLDLIEQVLPHLRALGVQLVALGTGDRRYEDVFRHHAEEAPGQIAACIGFDTELARRIYAGADMLLMPSRFEPCGLAQLIAMRYGTIPVVRATGGLADTVRDFDPASGEGTGFAFTDYDAWALYTAVVRAVETYRHRSIWASIVRQAMTRDVSWASSAARYANLYRAAIASHREQAARGKAPAGTRAG